MATLKARAMKEVWNIASVIPMDKGLTSTGGCSNVHNGSNGSSSSSHSGELMQQENFLGTCSREWLARGCELLKRTRKGNNKFYLSFFVYVLVLWIFCSNASLCYFCRRSPLENSFCLHQQDESGKGLFPLVSRDVFTLGDDR